MNCELLTKIIIVVAVCFIVSCVFNNSNTSEGYATYEQDSNENPGNVIGMVYPPSAGPLHSNAEFPVKGDSCPRSFVAIYDQEPFLRYYGKSDNTCTM